MGADLLLAYVAHRHGVQPSVQKAQEFIKKITADDIKTKMNGDFVEDFDADWENPTERDVREIQQQLDGWIQEVVATLEDSRQVGMFQICGWDIYLTGGLSWGDDPTDVMGTWNKLWDWGDLALEVYKAAGLDFPPAGPDQFVIQEMTP